MAELEEVRSRGQRWLVMDDAPSAVDPLMRMHEDAAGLDLARSIIEEFIEVTSPKPKRRSPWTWPLIALGAIMVLAVGGTVLAIVTS